MHPSRWRDAIDSLLTQIHSANGQVRGARCLRDSYAELYDLELAEVIVDAGESAKHLDRPGLQRALAMLKRGEAEALLVVKLDLIGEIPPSISTGD